MAKPRIFVSSTFYDLKYVRSSLEIFIESLGYEAILSEKGDIAYTPDATLDESCYREAQNSDIYVLIIGGRYGSEASSQEAFDEADSLEGFYRRYTSITEAEYKAAVERGIPIYILVERSVHAELQTFRKNKANQDIKYAHVDSVNVFHFIERILAQARNNPLQPFDRYADIEGWLRDQWAGFFRELLNQQSSKQEIASLAAQVSTLADVNKTLQRYLEEVMSKVAPEDAKKLIAKENNRLSEAEQIRSVIGKPVFKLLARSFDLEAYRLVTILANAQDYNDFVRNFASEATKLKDMGIDPLPLLRQYDINPKFQRDINELRAILGQSPFFLIANDENPSHIGGDGDNTLSNTLKTLSRKVKTPE